MADALAFGPFVLDAREYRLTRNGLPVALPPKPFDLLLALARRPAQLVTRDELLADVWKDTVVEQSSLNAAMSVLRQALGEDAASIIETVPGRGYRFIAATTTQPSPSPSPSTAGKRVVIVDDHAVVRMGVRALAERAGHACAGEAGTLEDADAVIRSTQPDLLVLDLMMGDQESIARVPSWREAVPAMRIVMLSMHHEDDYARQALAAGAHAYVMKGEMLNELQTAIAAVLAGDLWVSASLSRSIVQDHLRSVSR